MVEYPDAFVEHIDRPARNSNGEGKARKRGGKVAEEARPPEFSDDALALAFADRHQNDLRYVAAWSSWLSYDGSRWQADDTLAAFDRARKICREAAARCEKQRTASAVASAKAVGAVYSLARADRKLAATVAQWDSDPWLLNTPDGVIDLKSGASRDHVAADYLTKITAVTPGGACPLWLTVIERATGGDHELTTYLKRLFGYCLTGSTREQTLHFAHGKGANSKGTILNTIAGILGDYHKAAPIETFTASPRDRHPTDLADLHGARMVTATETEEGRRWAESRIKMLTGGDPVKARFMRQDFFAYMPQFTLLIMGNHKPSLRSVDESIRRRFHLIPFDVTIPQHERDLQLADKLKGEWPGILAWAIEGCLEWQQQGLAAPASVRTATADYLEAEDNTAAWIDECCERDPNAWAGSPVLFANWKDWAERSREEIGNTKRFREQLEARGIIYKRGVTGRAGYQGLRIRTDGDEPREPHWDR